MKVTSEHIYRKEFWDKIILLSDSDLKTIQNEITHNQYFKKQIGIFKNYKIFAINGNTIKTKIYMDFVEAGNPKRYLFIPKNEIWVDAFLNFEDWKYVLLHECVEMYYMHFFKFTYDNAHDVANGVEKYFRTHTTMVKESADYRIAHEAPTRENGSPIYDLSGIYPEDFYSPMGAQYYGHYGQRHPLDVQTASIIQGLRNRPNAKVKIYRAVPNKPTNEDQIRKYEAQKAYIMKHGEKPPLIDRKFKDLTHSDYYGYISDEIDRLKKTPEPVQPKYTINKGDWVTINRNYAKEHGLTLTGGNYQILTKMVDAKDLYTSGDSIHEFGYDPE